MDIYKKAAQQRLRFSTNIGALTTEQLFDLTIEQLDKLAVQLNEQYEHSNNKSFIRETSEKDKKAKLMFDVVYDVLQTKVANQDKANKARETREHNEKILRLIQERKEEDLKSLSLEELEAQLKQ